MVRLGEGAVAAAGSPRPIYGVRSGLAPARSWCVAIALPEQGPVEGDDRIRVLDEESSAARDRDADVVLTALRRIERCQPIAERQ